MIQYNNYTIMSQRNIITVIWQCQDVPMLFLVATDAGLVVGGYAPLLWRTTGILP